MHFLQIFLLVFLPIGYVCQSASPVAEEGMSESELIPGGQHDVLALLLANFTNLTPGQGVFGSTLNARDGRVGSSVEEKGGLHEFQAVNGASKALGPSVRGRVHCNPEVRSISAWDKRVKQMEVYGGEEAHRIPWEIYKTNAVVKRMVINSEAQKVLGRRRIAILNRVQQLKGWCIIRQGKEEIWQVIQTWEGMSPKNAKRTLREDQLQHIQARARGWDAVHFGLRLPLNVENDLERYRFIRQSHEWIGLIVGWQGTERITGLPILRERPRLIVLPDDDDILVRAWNRRGSPITYGGEDAYPFHYHSKPAVIRAISIDGEDDDIVARHQIAIYQRVGQYIDWVILHHGGEETWLVAQTWEGIPAKKTGLKDDELKSIQDRESHLYASVFRLRLPKDAAERFTYLLSRTLMKTGTKIEIKMTWIGRVVGWAGVESTEAPDLHMEPEIICDADA